MNTSTYQTLLRQFQITTAFTGGCLDKLFRRLRNASYTVIAVASILAIALCSVAMADGDNRDSNRYDESAEFASAIKHYEVENFSKAREIWANAAAKGGVRSQYRLGEIYEYGVGVDKDLVEAHLWYSLSADSGSLRSERALFRIENIMSEEQIISAQMLLAEFSPIYTASRSKSGKAADPKLSESTPDSTSTKGKVAKNPSQPQPAQAVVGSTAKSNSSTGTNSQAAPDSIDASLFTAIPTTTPETIKADSQAVDSSSTRSRQPTDKTTESEFEKRRMKLVRASGPGPQVVNDVVQPAAAPELTAQTAAKESADKAEIASADTAASPESSAHADSQTPDADSAIADTAITRESVSRETGSGKVVRDEAVGDDDATSEEALTESVEVVVPAPEQATAKSAGAKSALKAVALKQSAVARSITTSIKPRDSASASSSESGELTASAVDLTTSDPVQQSEPATSQATANERGPVDDANVGEASNLKQLVEAPSVQMPQLALVETDRNSPKSLLEEPVPSGLTGASGGREGVQSIQQMLMQLGYKIDGESGQIGPQTRKAIQAFRRDSALLVSTLIDVDFLAALYKRHAAVKN